jgi:hypothetical protein
MALIAASEFSINDVSHVFGVPASDSSRWIGVRSGKEPVAMIADLKLTSSLPSTPIVFASLNVPVPLIHSTLLMRFSVK